MPALSLPPPPAAREAIDVPVALGLLGLHVGALAALWHLSWFGPGLAILSYRTAARMAGAVQAPRPGRLADYGP